MALFRKTAATKQHLAYQAYHKEAKEKGKRPLMFRAWINAGKPTGKISKPITTVRTKAVESQLKAAGLTEQEIAKLRGKK